MTHTASHIIIHKFTAPVTFSETAKPGKLKVWHCAALLVAVGFAIGLAF